MLDELFDGADGALEQLDLAAEIRRADLGAAEQQALPELLERLGDLVERGAEGLDVLAFERRDERLRQPGAEFLGDPLVLLAQQRELVQRRAAAARCPEQSDEQTDALPRFLGGFLQIPLPHDCVVKPIGHVLPDHPRQARQLRLISPLHFIDGERDQKPHRHPHP